MERIRLYHKDRPAGKIFISKSAVADAIENGWKEAPWLIHEDEPKPEEKPDPEKEDGEDNIAIDVDNDGEADIIIPRKKSRRKK